MRERRKQVRIKNNVTIAEQRRFVRLPKRNVVRFREFRFTDEPPRYFDAHYKDISGGGLLFESSHAFTVGTLLKIELKVHGWDRFKTEFFKPGSDSGSEPLVVLAEVVRVEAVEQDRKYDVGVIFVGIDESHRDALMRFIASQFGL